MVCMADKSSFVTPSFESRTCQAKLHFCSQSEQAVTTRGHLEMKPNCHANSWYEAGIADCGQTFYCIV